MKLTAEERFALCKIFHGKSKIDIAVVEGLDWGEVISRKKTKVGFFATILFSNGLPNDSGLVQWDWSFEHKKLKHGGSFIGCYVALNIIELEVIAHGGEWPVHFDSGDYIED